MMIYKVLIKLGGLKMRRLIEAPTIALVAEQVEGMGLPAAALKAVHVASTEQRERLTFLDPDDAHLEAVP